VPGELRLPSLNRPPGTTTTFILVRHAEKANLTTESPLSVAGQERARALVDALAPLGVTAIYCPALRRNRETVQPLSEHLGLVIRTIPGWQVLNTRRFAQDFIQKALANQGGGVILWAGNSSAVGAWGSNLQELPFTMSPLSAPGPSGCLLAHALATAGWAVLLLEKKQLPRYKTCGGGLTQRALKLIPFDIQEVIEDQAHTTRLRVHYKPLFPKHGTSRPCIW
jgi:phosphohistidine phosphatase SixA